MYLLLLGVGLLLTAGRLYRLPSLPFPPDLVNARAEGLLPWGLWSFLAAWGASSLLPVRWVPLAAFLSSIAAMGAACLAEGVSV